MDAAQSRAPLQTFTPRGAPTAASLRRTRKQIFMRLSLTSRITRAIVAAGTLLALAATPAAAAPPRVDAFRASVDGSQIQYRVVLCAPVGARVVFTPELRDSRGRTFVSPDQVGRQQSGCPIWRFSEPDRYRPGRYSVRVRVQVGSDMVFTPRRRLTLG